MIPGFSTHGPLLERYVLAEYLPCGDVELVEPDVRGEFHFPTECPACLGPVESVRDA